MSHLTKVFKNGRSQAVRIPTEYRFDTKEVYIRRDPATGDIILSRRPGDWGEFFALVQSLDIPQDFLREREDLPAQARDLF